MILPQTQILEVGWFQCLVNVMNVYQCLVGQVMIPPDWSHTNMECMSQGLSGLIIRVAIQNGDVGRSVPTNASERLSGHEQSQGLLSTKGRLAQMMFPHGQRC